MRITNSNYVNTEGKDYIETSYTLKVKQRPITIKAQDKETEYTGNEIGPDKGAYELSNGTLADGDSLESVSLSGGAVEVGKHEKVLAVSNGKISKNKEGVKEDVTKNYAISYEPGTLTITRKSWADVGVNVTNGEKTYDGTPVKGQLELDHVPAGSKIEYSTDGGNKWSTEEPGQTDYTENPVTVKVRITNPNYEGQLDTNYTLKINKKEVYLSSGSDSREYNGQPLTKPGVSGTEGFISKDNITAKAVGSITDVGSKENTIKVNGNKDVLNNYDIKYEPGTLTITPKVTQGLEITPPRDVEYNGESQKQKPDVKIGETTLEEGKDYDLIYPDDTKNVGKVTVIVKGKGDYTGTETTVDYHSIV